MTSQSTEINDVIDNSIGSLVAKINALKIDMLKAGKDAFNEAVVILFNTYPNLQSFSWQQYTPYFNDGDTCYFRVSEHYDINLHTPSEEDLKAEDAYDWHGDPIAQYERLVEYYPDKYFAKEFSEGYYICRDINTIISKIPTDVMLAMFGDHAMITATKDSVTIEEYDHE